MVRVLPSAGKIIAQCERRRIYRKIGHALSTPILAPDRLEIVCGRELWERRNARQPIETADELPKELRATLHPLGRRSSAAVHPSARPYLLIVAADSM